MHCKAVLRRFPKRVAFPPVSIFVQSPWKVQSCPPINEFAPGNRCIGTCPNLLLLFSTCCAHHLACSRGEDGWTKNNAANLTYSTDFMQIFDEPHQPTTFDWIMPKPIISFFDFCTEEKNSCFSSSTSREALRRPTPAANYTTSAHPKWAGSPPQWTSLKQTAPTIYN